MLFFSSFSRAAASNIYKHITATMMMAKDHSHQVLHGELARFMSRTLWCDRSLKLCIYCTVQIPVACRYYRTVPGATQVLAIRLTSYTVNQTQRANDKIHDDTKRRQPQPLIQSIFWNTSKKLSITEPQRSCIVLVSIII